MARSIQEMFNKFKLLVEEDSLFYGMLIILVAVSSFGLGRLSDDQAQPQTGQTAAISMRETVPDREKTPSSVVETTETVSKYVASKNGTKYHLPWCPGASQIKEENKIYFTSKEEAQEAGYTPASNCKGI